MTGQRRVIARVLSDASDHPDVEELYRRAARLDARISIATVYRTVRLLEERGILERRDFGGGRARYEPTEHGHHYHLIDIDTGKVVEFQEPEHERLLAEVAERLGFELVSLRLELFGRRLAVAGTEPRRAGRAARPGAGPEGEAARGLVAAPPAAATMTGDSQSGDPVVVGAAPDGPEPGTPLTGTATEPARFPELRAGHLGVRLATTAAETRRGAGTALSHLLHRDGRQPRSDRAGERARPRPVRCGGRPPAGDRPCDRPRAGRRGRHLPADPAHGGGARRRILFGSRIRPRPDPALPRPHPGARPLLRRCRLPQQRGDAAAVARHRRVRVP